MANKLRARRPLTCQIDESTGVVLIEAESTLLTEDFATISQVIDPFYEKYGELNGIIFNAKKFPFWQGSAGFKEYTSFAKNNHYKTKKVALTMGGFFPKVLRRLAGRFIHAELKNFGYNKLEAAEGWILP